MEFLKEALGEELFAQFEEKINAFNGNGENKDNQIKLANLTGGEYVGKGKYDGIQEQLTGKNSELDTANKLITELKKATKENEGVQGKIGEYESRVEQLQSQLAETKLKSAIKVALLSEKATDVDYLTFKLNEKMKEQGSTLELDENDNIKGWDDKASALKTQFPSQFEGKGTGEKFINSNKLPEDQNEKGLTKSEILKKPYAERTALYNDNPEAYKEAMNK